MTKLELLDSLEQEIRTEISGPMSKGKKLDIIYDNMDLINTYAQVCQAQSQMSIAIGVKKFVDDKVEEKRYINVGREP